MNQDKIFENISEMNKSLWDRIKIFSENLNLTQEDEEIFTGKDASVAAYYVNTYFNKCITVGVHLARVRKMKQTFETKKEKLFGKLYVEVTEECISGKNSSKYDQLYRTGKVTSNKEYQDITELVIELTELEGSLESVRNSLNMKSTILPTMFKLDKNNY